MAKKTPKKAAPKNSATKAAQAKTKAAAKAAKRAKELKAELVAKNDTPEEATAKEIKKAARVAKIEASKERKVVFDKALKAKFPFSDNEMVILIGTDNKKFKISSEKTFALVGHSAKQLIAKGAAEFVKKAKKSK